MRARSLLLTAPEQLVWIDEELPEPAPSQLLVETLAGAISIGTELPRYLGISRGHTPEYPVMTGYESVARVLRCGAGVDHFAPGDRLVSFYGHRTHAIVPVDKAIPAPSDISDELAILAILSCDCAKGVRKIEPCSGDRVLITGGGTIGLLTLWILKAYCVESVDLIEPLAERRNLARRFGASNVYTGDAQERIETDYAYGFECSSRDAAFALLQRSVRPGGAICVLADGNLEPLTLTPDFHRKELRVAGSSDGWDYHVHARWSFERARNHHELLTSLFEWHVSASELAGTFKRLASGPGRPTKVFVRYEQDSAGVT